MRAYGVTVRRAGALATPEALATMVTVPGASPVASPLPSMVAVPEKLQDQLKMAPVMALPLASSAVAANCWVAFTATEADIGEMETDTMGCETVSVAAVLVTLPVEAVI